jgi:hypothetical protein
LLSVGLRFFNQPAAGYWVLTAAEKRNTNLNKILGNILGWVIMGLSLLCLLGFGMFSIVGRMNGGGTPGP